MKFGIEWSDDKTEKILITIFSECYVGNRRYIIIIRKKKRRFIFKIMFNFLYGDKMRKKDFYTLTYIVACFKE